MKVTISTINFFQTARRGNREKLFILVLDEELPPVLVALPPEELLPVLVLSKVLLVAQVQVRLQHASPYVALLAEGKQLRLPLMLLPPAL